MGTRRQRAARQSRVEVSVAAPVNAVWQVVADVTRTGEWSHECLHVEWVNGSDRAVPGARFRGRNRSRWLRWSRSCEIIAVQPPHRIVWRTIPTPLYVDSTEWSIQLEPTAHGTRIIQEFQLLKCPQWWEWVATRLIPAHLDRSQALSEDLHRLGVVAMAATGTVNRPTAR